MLVPRSIQFLSEDARIRMPPEPHEYQGRERSPHSFAYYLEDRNAEVARIGGVFVLSADGGSIGTCTRFGDTGVLPFFGLPRTFPV